MSFQDRRFEPRSPANARGVVVAPGLEMPCLITDVSGAGLKVRLDRNLALPKQVQIVDIAQGVAIEAEVAWAKGQEAGFRRTGQASLRGLTPSRLAAARAAYLRAGGR
ncbi:PilZ domain-containing protein [Brevundimonas sp. GCM10030266]|uniref:PilZ domain-containing protein n=1 Tax=Brevundimonas sp. GCM10030266 TaxID=3273386 RepID=UPI00361E780E